MKLINQRVAWVEGILLEPQHFQQQERFLEHALAERISQTIAYGWGLTELSIDRALLGQGKVGLSSIRGAFIDGSAFDLPVDAPLPEPWDAHGAVAGEEICLALKLDMAGVPLVDLSGSARHARYTAATAEVADRTYGVAEEASPRTTLVQVGQLQTRLVSRSSLGGSDAAISIARVLDRMASGEVRLDPAFVPPTLDAHASANLVDVARDIHGLIVTRLEAFSRQDAPSQRMGNLSDLLELMLTQVLGEYRLALQHALTLRPLHPERLYQMLMGLLGRLCMLPGAPDGSGLPPYDHANPGPSYRALWAELRRALSLVIESPAVALTFGEGDERFSICTNDPHWRLQKIIFAVKAQVAANRLRNDFPLHAKLGPVETINQLIDLQLPGVRMTNVALPPRHIPYYPDGVYFEVDSHGPAWTELLASSAMALSIVGDFPGLQVEAWGLREVSTR